MNSRADRSQVRGIRLAGGDLLAEIRRKQRRRVLKRAAQFGVLATTLLGAGVLLKVVGDRRAVGSALEVARSYGENGTVADLRLAADVLDASLARAPHDASTLADRALIRAHLWLEFGEGEEQARAALEAAPGDQTATAIARAAVLFGQGEPAAAQAALAAVGTPGREPERGEAAWLGAMLAIAVNPDDPTALGAAKDEIDAVLDSVPGNAALRRLRARLLLQLGDGDEALAELDRARELARGHLGLAADEALYNAYLRREPSGVASVADQLLERAQTEALSPRDRTNTQLARGLVHVRSGELDDGLGLLEQAHDGLPPWDRLGLRLVIEGALEAGAADLAATWLKDADLPEDEIRIDEAWIKLVRGDMMTALEQLASLPQSHPRVAYLQALALVEQRRWSEAMPWITRSEQLLPDRIELEVAHARAEVHVGDRALALRKLQALAEEEPWAPRAWTGLGEAWLAQTDQVDLAQAQIALERAIEREPLAAEAMVLLADIFDRRRKSEPAGIAQGLRLLERAVATNGFLPRYREQLAARLADSGYPERARPLFAELQGARGVSADSLLRYADLALEAADASVDYKDLLSRAESRGADLGEVNRLRAWAMMVDDKRDGVAKAQAALIALVEAEPSNIPARVLLAETYIRQRDRKEAELVIRRGFHHVADRQQGRLLLAWAGLESRLGKPKLAASRARAAWLRLLDEDRPPTELLAAADLATRLWLRQGQDRVANKIAEQLTKRVPEHSEAWTIRARAELGAGEAGAARSSADRALALDAENPRAHEIRGHCLLRFGQKDEARRAYERAVTLAAGTDAENTYRENLRRL